MSDRTITRQFVIANAFQVFKVTTDEAEAYAYFRSAKNFSEGVTITTEKANR